MYNSLLSSKLHIPNSVGTAKGYDQYRSTKTFSVILGNSADVWVYIVITYSN